MVRTMAANLALRNELSEGHAWLDQVFRDSSLPRLGLIPGGPQVDFRWRLVIACGPGIVLQLGLPPDLFDALGVGEDTLATQGQALVAQCASPLLPALRGFFADEVELRVEPAPRGWPETERWALFQLTIPSLRRTLPGRLVDRFALKLRDLVVTRPRPHGIDLPLPLFAGAQLRLPVSAVLKLRPGDVLLCGQAPPGTAKQIRLYTESAASRREGRYLATVRTEDGCVEHLSPGVLHELRDTSSTGAPEVAADIVEGRLTLSAARCKALTIGQCIEGWGGVAWLEEPQLRIGGRPRALLRRTRLAGQPGYEVLQLHRSR